jgi:hypothetical protein
MNRFRVLRVALVNLHISRLIPGDVRLQTLKVFHTTFSYLLKFLLQFSVAFWRLFTLCHLLIIDVALTIAVEISVLKAAVQDLQVLLQTIDLSNLVTAQHICDDLWVLILDELLLKLELFKFEIRAVLKLL